MLTATDMAPASAAAVDKVEAVAGARGATMEQVGAAAGAADAMLLHDYHPLDIKNPTLGRHYKAGGLFITSTRLLAHHHPN